MIKVFLREKKLLNSRRGLYLDFYPPITQPETGKQTRREHLGLFIHEKPRNEHEREHNKETKMLGDNIRAQRQLELQSGAYGFITVRSKQKDFIEYFRQVVESKKATSKSNYENWLSVIKHFKTFTGETVRFANITEALCVDFKEYLLKHDKLSQNTAAAYFDKFKALVRDAFGEKLLSENPARRVRSIKIDDTQREFLSLEELTALANTPFQYEDLRRASLFSALTGLRYSDIAKLIWSEIQHSESQGYYLRFRQKKTNGTETLPISNEAFELLGTTGLPEERVFKNLEYWQCSYLPIWTAKAGIDKKITFHCFRHTNATLQIASGTDIYTLSKMLGHKNISTTQIYAKIVDERKREAANRITLKHE